MNQQSTLLRNLYYGRQSVRIAKITVSLDRIYIMVNYDNSAIEQLCREHCRNGRFQVAVQC